MSVIVVAGVRYAAGLTWATRKGTWATAMMARQIRAHMIVHSEGQTGYAPAGIAAPLPALALALQAHIGADSWCALVAGENGQWAVIACSDRQMLSGSDEVFASPEPAIAAFEEHRSDDSWGHYASRGLVEGAVDLDIECLTSDTLLEPAPLRSVTPATLTTASALTLVPISSFAVWMYWTDIKNMIWPPPPPPPRVVKAPEPQVKVSIDAAALFAGCREAIRQHPPSLPGWRRSDLRCTARFRDRQLTKLRTDLAGKPALIVKWRLEPNHAEPLWRRIAESHFESWVIRHQGITGSVTGKTAWAVVPLPPVAIAVDTVSQPSVLDLRRSIDERFGARALRLKTGSSQMQIEMAQPLERIATLMEGLRGIEVLNLREKTHGWIVDIRRSAPVTMPKSQLARLRRTS